MDNNILEQQPEFKPYIKSMRPSGFIWAGLFMLILAALAWYFSFTVSISLMIIIGVLLTFGGIAQLTQALMHHAYRNSRFWAAASGCLFILSGILFCIYPALSDLFVTTFIAILFIMSGVMRIIWAIKDRFLPGWWMVLLNGIISFVLGVLLYIICIKHPLQSLVFIGILVSVELTVGAITALIFGFSLRSFQKDNL